MTSKTPQKISKLRKEFIKNQVKHTATALEYCLLKIEEIRLKTGLSLYAPKPKTEKWYIQDSTKHELVFKGTFGQCCDFVLERYYKK